MQITKNNILFTKAKNFFSQMISPINYFKAWKIQTLVKKKALFTTAKDIDLLHVLTKIKEIDKLKNIILDKDQKNLFEYIPKSKINLENDNHFRMNRTSMLFMLKNNNKLRDSLKKENDYNLDDFFLLYNSYKNMIVEKNPSKKEINDKIFKTLNPELLKIFQREGEKNIQSSKESGFLIRSSH